MPPCFSSCSRPMTSRRSSPADRLEQLVLGERLEERRDGLVVVRAGDQVLGREHLLELVMQERRLGGRLHVRLRREQADHPCLADDLAFGAHAPHADVVHARATVHGRVGVGLREDQQVAVLDPASEPGIEASRAAWCRRTSSGSTSDRMPSPLPGTALDRAAVGRVDQLVLAVAQEDEVQLQQPVEEVDRLADLLRGVAHGRLACHLAACAGRGPASVRSRAPPAGRRAGSREACSSRSARSRSVRRRSSSKWITDSRCDASRPARTWAMRPSSARRVPIIGCSRRRALQVAASAPR